MYPLFLKPILKRARWGGRRLEHLFHKPLGPESDYAESWEVVDRGDLQSVVENGEFQGWTLRSLLDRHPAEILGRHAGVPRFPLLVKLLDATDMLSVQVHPNCRQAAAMQLSDAGKSEAWIVLETTPNSRLYVGVQEGVDADVLRAAIQSGTVDRYLHSFAPKRGDCVYIPAGTIHAIGAGIVLAEVQQSSDLTFRLFDWGRVGTDGLPRELHIEEALRCADFARGPVDPVIPRITSMGGARVERLIECEHFVMQRIESERPLRIEDDDQIRILLMLDGEAEVSSGVNARQMLRGQTVLIPAAHSAIVITPRAHSTILEVTLGEA